MLLKVKKAFVAIGFALLLAALIPDTAWAQSAMSGGLDRAVGQIAGDGRPLSLSLQILLLMGLLTV